MANSIYNLLYQISSGHDFSSSDLLLTFVTGRKINIILETQAHGLMKRAVKYRSKLIIKADWETTLLSEIIDYKCSNFCVVWITWVPRSTEFIILTNWPYNIGNAY